MSDWQPIETAPKDGRFLLLTALDPDGNTDEAHMMQWCHIQKNDLCAPGMIGMWTAPDGSYTWRDGEYGPTHWQPSHGPATA